MARKCSCAFYFYVVCTQQQVDPRLNSADDAMTVKTRLALYLLGFALLRAATQADAELKDPREEKFPADSPRLVRGLTTCACSPSGRGVLPAATETIGRALRIANSAIDAAPSSGDPAAMVEARITAKLEVVTQLDACKKAVGLEACINSAAAARARFGEPLCAHDSNTGRNVVRRSDDTFATVGVCSESAEYQSSVLASEATAPRKTPTPRPAYSPSSRPASSPSTSPKPKPSKSSAARPAPSSSSAPTSKPDPVAVAPPAPLTSKWPASSASPSCSSGMSPSPSPAMKKRKEINEGCVAIEHLQGYKLQHRRHLRREVLCAHGFCATPNHEIEVYGVRTSMKKMCGCNGRWKCVQTIKLVNNLKLAYNDRARMSSAIVVTPYDHRFPRFVVWIVQMAEDVLALLFTSASVALIAAVSTLILATKK